MQDCGGTEVVWWRKTVLNPVFLVLIILFRLIALKKRLYCISLRKFGTLLRSIPEDIYGFRREPKRTKDRHLEFERPG